MFNRQKIAIIDNDTDVRSALSSFLEVWGLEIQAFEHAEALFDSPMLELCDCVVTDLRMPGIRGTAMLRALRLRRATLPIVVLSAEPPERVRAAALKAGASAFLSKPVPGAALAEAIALAFGSIKA